MGVVYRAHDSRLGRDVAIKVLPEAFARDPDRMARFEREARTLASLNHPNIATLLGIEQGALVMELVEGDALRCPVPEETAVDYARQIADALEHAHEKGITHRDLKPANVRITPEGKVKLLDFGLAKAMDSQSGGGDPENSPTLTAPLSSTGLIMGTAGYMSPEQAHGARVDHRSDIWAFGVVLYEMLAGRSPFKGETVSDTLAAILKTDPDLDAVPLRFRPLLRRCLERDVHKRLGWIGEARGMMDAAPPPVMAAQQRRGIPVWALAAAALLAGVGGWLMRAPKPAVELPFRAFSFTPDALSTIDYAHRAVISPNGKSIAYVAANKLWIRDMASEQARAVEGTENAEGPFWSPDSLQVAYGVGKELRKSSISGGMPFTLTTLTTGAYRGGAWSPDGRVIVFSGTPAGLFEIPAEGGNAKAVFPEKKAGTFYAPHFVSGADGERVLVASTGGRNHQALHLIDLRSAKEETIRATGAYPTFATSGHILFQTEARKPGLWALAVSTVTKKPVGEAFPILNTGTDVSASVDGTLVWCDSPIDENLQFVWRDRAGKKTGLPGSASGSLRGIRLSPDATRVAFAAREQGNIDVWIQDLVRSSKSRFTFSPELDAYPTWSPSGKEIAFGSQQPGRSDIYLQSADGSGEPKAILLGPTIDHPTGWSPDGRTLLVSRSDPKTGNDLWFMRRKLDGSFEEPVAFLHSTFNEQFGQFSPDGRFVVYVSDEAGRNGVYVRSFPDGEGKRQMSADGGNFPRWSRDGKEIFYVKGEALWAVPLNGAAVELFRSPGFLAGQLFHNYDVTPDGKRFLITEPVDDGKAGPRAIHVVQNWPALLRQKPE